MGYANIASLDKGKGWDKMKERMFIIVRNKKSHAEIVIDSKKLKTLASEIQKYVAKVTGARIPVKYLENSSLRNRILIVKNHNSLPPGVNISKLKEEGFIIKRVNADLIITGKDMRGVSYGIYTFLEKFVGIRWLWPGETGEVIPKLKRLEIKGDIDIREEPDYFMRFIPSGRSNPKAQVHPNSFKGKIGLWRKRNKVGGSVEIRGVHAFGEIVPPRKYFHNHPEYYALVNGKRGGEEIKYALLKNVDDFHLAGNWQVCTTNPDVIKLTVEYVMRKFNETSKSVIINVSPNDGFGFCECEKCKSLDTKETTGEFSLNGERFPLISERIFTFVNQVARNVIETHPNRFINILAYGFYHKVPNNIPRLADNVIVQYCVGCHGHCAPEVKKRDYDRIKNWARYHTHIGIYEYFIMGIWPGTPRVYASLIAEAIKNYHKMGVRYFFTQAANNWATCGVNYYVAAKLLWNTRLNYRGILNDYYKRGFGHAADVIKNYFMLHERKLKEVMKRKIPGVVDHFHKSRKPELFLDAVLLDKCKKLLEEAERLSAGDKQIRKRINFVKKGFVYTRLHYEAIESLERLKEVGISTSIPSQRKTPDAGTLGLLSCEGDSIKNRGHASPRCILRLIDNAISKWKRRERFLGRYKGDIIVDYEWIKKGADDPDWADDSFSYVRVLKKLKRLRKNYETRD